MTLQWTFVATVLYGEVFLVSILLLPFISPKTWQRVFRSSLVSWASTYSKFYFYVFIAILVLLFSESVRETMKYSEPIDSEELRRYPEAEVAMHMKLFRAQRNMYIAGFALFLWFILRRLVVLIASEATLMAESEAAMRQAQSASAAAQAMLDGQATDKDNKKNAAAEKKEEETVKKDASSADKELAVARSELEQTKEQLYKAQADLSALKKQAEGTNIEYDRLLLEHEKLQNKLSSMEGGDDKKGN